MSPATLDSLASTPSASSDSSLRGRPLHAAMLTAFDYSPVLDTAYQHYGLSRADAASLFDGLLQSLRGLLQQPPSDQRRWRSDGEAAGAVAGIHVALLGRPPGG